MRRRPGPGGTGMPPRAGCPSGPSVACGGRSSRYTQCHSSGSPSASGTPGTPSSPASAAAGPGVISSVTSRTSLIREDDLAELDGAVAQQWPDPGYGDALVVRAGRVGVEGFAALVALVQDERVRVL